MKLSLFQLTVFLFSSIYVCFTKDAKDDDSKITSPTTTKNVRRASSILTIEVLPNEENDIDDGLKLYDILIDEMTGDKKNKDKKSTDNANNERYL